jgi:hypothetical protein
LGRRFTARLGPSGPIRIHRQIQRRVPRCVPQPPPAQGEKTTSHLDACVQDAQRGRIVITRSGIPVAHIDGIEGMDEEQV